MQGKHDIPVQFVRGVRMQQTASVQVTMLDALRKRCEFVDAAAERVGLTNVRTLWMRAEDAGRDPTLREVWSMNLSLPP